MAEPSRRTWAGIGYTGPIEGKSREVRHALVAAFTLPNGLSFLAAACLCQAALPGGGMGMAVAFVAALLLMKKPALPALLGIALGLTVRWAPIGWLNGWQLASAALLMVVLGRGWIARTWQMSLAATASMLLPLPFVSTQAEALLALVTGALTAGLLTPVFSRAWLAFVPEHAPMSQDDKLCALLGVAGICMGTLWVSVEGILLSDILIALCLFAVGFAGGPGMALPTGVLLGLSRMAVGGTFDTLILWAVVGALAGTLRGGLRILPVLGAMLGAALCAYAQGGIPQWLLSLPALASGGLIFVLVPKRFLTALSGMLESHALPLPEPNAIACRHLLLERAHAFLSMARALPTVDPVGDQAPVELLACRLCTGCSEQAICWDQRRDQAMALLDGVLGTLDLGPVAIEQAARLYGCVRASDVHPFAEGLTRARAREEGDRTRRQEARAWALSQLSAQAHALTHLSEQLGEDSPRIELVRAALCQAMPTLRGRPDALTIMEINGKLHLWFDIHVTDGQVERLAHAIGKASGVRVACKESTADTDALLFVEQTGLTLSVGRTITPIAGEEVSGDSLLYEAVDGGRMMLALSDGMGSGRAAHQESKAACAMLWQALKAGFSREDALKAVNGLLVACRGDEMFATMDLCVIDLSTGVVEFEKLGACPSFILRAGRVRRIGGDALPMGILDAVRPRALTARLSLGDTLLLVSDGVLDAFSGDEAQFVRALGGLTSIAHTPDPQRLCDTVMRRALERVGDVAMDDMSLLAVRLDVA